MKLLIATNNQGKVAELARLLDIKGLELVMHAEVGLIDFDVEETGLTYFENASLKAVAFAKASGLPSLADDSGLEVDGLDGEPGIYAKRYAGENVTDAERIAFLLKKLEERPGAARTAEFVAMLVLSDPSGKILAQEIGHCEGHIGFEPRGTNGFGYDPIFVTQLNHRTMAELTNSEKDAISHRGNAARKMAQRLREIF